MILVSFFGSQYRKISSGNLFVFQKFYNRNFSCIGGGRVSRFSVGRFCLTVPKKFYRWTVLCLWNFSCRKMLRKRKWVHITILRRIFWSHSAETFRRGTFLCSKFFWNRKIIRIRKGGRHDCASKWFHLTERKHFVEEPFCVSETIFWKNVREKKVGGHHDCPKNFLSHCFETFRREAFIFSEKIWFRNFSCIRGVGDQDSPYNYFVSQYRKILSRNPFVFQKTFDFEKR